MMALQHPGLFSAVAAHSADMYFEYAYLPEFPVAVRGLERAGGLSAFLQTIGKGPLSGREEHAAVNIVAMAACYSPNPQSPHLFDLPFDERTGELMRDVWSRWKEKDPLEYAKSQTAALRRLGLIYLDCGRRDEFYLNLGARMFSRELRKQGIAHTYEEFDGGHSNVQFRYDTSLRKLAEYFGA